MAIVLLFVAASCKKSHITPVVTVVDATPVKLGLYELSDANTEELQVAVAKLGTVTVDYGLVWDTGSGGMVIDATDIIPAAMINANGFVFTGDSTVVDGITITNQTSTIVYGADDSTETTVYGNLPMHLLLLATREGRWLSNGFHFFYIIKLSGRITRQPISTRLM